MSDRVQGERFRVNSGTASPWMSKSSIQALCREVALQGPQDHDTMKCHCSHVTCVEHTARTACSLLKSYPSG